MMFTTADKSSLHSQAHQQAQAAVPRSFLQKKDEGGFFGRKKQDAGFFSPQSVQAKLTISQPNDPYEKEADQMAEKVMRMTDPAPVQPMHQPKEEELQRTEEDAGEEGIMPMLEISPVQRTQEAEQEEVHRKEEEGADEQVMTKAETGLVQRSEEEDDEHEEVQAKLESGNLSAPGIMRQEDNGNEGSTPAVQAKLHDTIQRSGTSEPEKKEHGGSGCSSCSGLKNINRKVQGNYSAPMLQRKDRGPPAVSTQFESSLRSSKGSGSPLPDNTRNSLENRFSADFSGVRIHTGNTAVQMNRDINAQAFTHGNDVYFNSGKYNPHTPGGGFLLAHELTHTIQQGASKRVQPKRLNGTAHSFVSTQTSLPPPAGKLTPVIQCKKQAQSTGEPRPELVRAVAHARSQEGLVRADDKGPDGYRKGWEHLVDYFSTAMGEDKIIKEGEQYRPGGVLINNIKKKTTIEAGKPKDTGGHTLQEVPGKANMVYRDAMPSWCGIFVFWALNKGGVPMPKWKLGIPAFPAASQYPKSYIPRVGDVAYRSAFSHFAIVEKSTGTGANTTVTTVNGNTAGENNMGGQVQVKDHPLSNWTFFFNPVYGMEGKLPENAVPVTAEEIKRISGQSGLSSSVVEKNLPVKFETNIKRLYGAAKVDKDGVKEKKEKEPGATSSPPQQKKEAGQTDEADTLAKNIPKAPASPAEDPGFKTVIAKSKKASVTQQQHAVHTEEAASAQKAAVPPANDQLSKAQANQVVVMSAQKKGKFSPEQFKEKMKEKIKAAIPESEDEAKKFKNNNKLEDVQKDMQGDVQAEKENASGAIETATKQAPDTSGIEEKEVVPMSVTDAGKKPVIPKASAAAPKTKTNEEISMEDDAKKLDTEMEKSDVSEDQLEKSNEPEFNSALSNKRESQNQARAGPQEYRAQEKPVLNKAENVAAAMVDGKMGDMFGDRAKLLGNGDTIKSDTKTKDEKKREEVANTLKGYYETTKINVETILGELDASVTKKFDEAAKKANKDFEDNVSRRLNKYYGWTTIDDAISEFVSGLPKEVHDIFMDEKDIFIKAMDKVINEIADEVSSKLNSAIEEIETGRKKVEDYVGKLEPALQEYGRQAADDILGKFDELEQSVEDKQNDLTDKLAKQYADNVGKLQEKFDKIKSDKQGLLGAALGALAAVIRTIKQLANMLFDVLAKVAHVVGKIIKDPISFLGNLVKAVGMGLTNFKDNIAEHLKKGFFEWLLGNMPPGIVFPKVWDLPGIFTFIMQIFGLSWVNIRDRAVKKMGEPVVQALETAFEIFQIIRKEGLAGLWKYIQDKIGDLKVMVLDAIMNFLVESVVKAGIMWIIGLLNPAGAFIKACKLIYDIIMFFVNNGRRIIELVNSIIDSIGLIVAGSLGQASKMVENALAKMVPIAIGFLASLLGLSGLSEKVQKIIHKIQAPVNKAIDWVLDKAIALAKKLGLDKVVKKVKAGVKKTKDWGKKKVKDAKKWAKKKVQKFKDKRKAKKDAKNKKVSAADEQKHKKYAKEVLTALGKKPAKQESFKDFKEEVEKKAKKLEQTYDKKLKKPVKMKISLSNFDDKHVKFNAKVHIGPNDTDMEEAITVMSGKTVVYQSEVGLRDKQGNIIASSRVKGSQEALIQALRDLLKHCNKDKKADGLDGNLAMGIIQISGLRKKEKPVGPLKAAEGVSEAFNIKITESDVPVIFSSAASVARTEGVGLMTGTIEVHENGGPKSIKLKDEKFKLRKDCSQDGLELIQKTGLDQAIIIEPNADVLAKDLEKHVVETVKQKEDAQKEGKNAITATDFYITYKHSEQAIYQAVKANDAAIASRIKALGLAEIHDMVLNVYTERDMCKNCACSGNELIKNLATAAPAIYAELNRVRSDVQNMRIIATSTYIFTNRAYNYEKELKATIDRIEKLKSNILSSEKNIEKILNIIERKEQRIADAKTPDTVRTNLSNSLPKSKAELEKHVALHVKRNADLKIHEDNLAVYLRDRTHITHEVSTRPMPLKEGVNEDTKPPELADLKKADASPDITPEVKSDI